MGDKMSRILKMNEILPILLNRSFLQDKYVYVINHICVGKSYKLLILQLVKYKCIPILKESLWDT